ncbi:ABC transporter substrate-binding protein [Burkholderia stagnalis]
MPDDLHATDMTPRRAGRTDAHAGRRRALGALCALPVASLAPGLAPPARAAAGATPRVASLSWAGAQILLSLGVAPLGLTECADYPRSGARPALPAGVIELGLHAEPNLELLQRIGPDLIVIDTNQAALDARLTRIAPTVTVDIYNPRRGTPLDRAIAETLRIGALLGREAAAHRHLADVDAQLAACAAAVSSLAARPPVLIVDLYDDGRHLYLYGPNSMMQDVMDRLGVRNAWRGSTDSGYLLTGIETLASMGDARMYYISHGARDRIALHNLSRSALWQHLPFVQAQRFVPLPGFFTYGATPCAVQFAQALTAGLTALDRRQERPRG